MTQQRIRPVGTAVGFAGLTGKHATGHPNFARDLARPLLLIIDPRYLEREALVGYLSMASAKRETEVVGCSSFEEWCARGTLPEQNVTILLNIGSRPSTDAACLAQICALIEQCGTRPVVVLGESEELADILAALEAGAKAYLPTSVGIDRIVEYAQVVIHGGVFLPRAAVLALRQTAPATTVQPQALALEQVFTGRQLDVYRSLRMGKSNKIIAYDLNLRESTVKVHIRNIMKKLGARNRTEAALKLNMSASCASFGDVSAQG